MSIDTGTVIWSMRGMEQNGVIKWYTKPTCVDEVTGSMVWFAGGGGCSLNNIGKTYFLSRKDALDDFLSRHDCLEEQLETGKTLPENVSSLPRTEWDDQRIYKYNGGVNDCGVYVGGLSRLKDITNLLLWEQRESKEYDYSDESLTLKQIYEQVSKQRGYEHSIITVIQNDPLKAHIYQCNNYGRGKWVKLGSCMGYA